MQWVPNGWQRTQYILINPLNLEPIKRNKKKQDAQNTEQFLFEPT